MTCTVCDGKGWVQAAAIVNRVTGEGEKAFVDVFHPVPCFMCAVVR